MKVDSPAIWGTQYCSANQSRRVEWLCLGTNRGCEGVDSHMQFLLVRAANSSVVGKPEVIWAFQHFVARSRNGLVGSLRMASRQRNPVKANATAFRQWRSWLRGADLNRRPLGYAI